MDKGKKAGKRDRTRISSLIWVVHSGVLFATALYVYWRTLSPTVNFIDSGELIAVCCLLGIAHPTGYPLYTLLGRLFTLGSGQPAVAMNFMSAFFGSVASMLVGLLVFFSLGTRGSEESVIVPPPVRYIVSLATGLLFAFSRTMWQASTETEVYSLAILFFALLLLISMPLLSSGSGSQSDSGYRLPRTLPLFGYVWGLSLGNHMSAVLLLPVAGYLLYLERVWQRDARKRLLLTAGAFLLGLMVYLYIPIRSMQEPILNWGHPGDLDSFVRHISAWQYRVWMFSGGMNALFGKMADYAGLLAHQFNPFLMVFVVPGGIFLFRRNRPLLTALIILFLSDLVYSLNYDIPDIAPYFLPSFLVVVVLIAAGACQVIRWVSSGQSRIAVPLAFVSLALPLSSVRSNYDVCDRSRDYMAREFAVNFLSAVSGNAVVLTRTWDLYAPVMYMQYVEKKRRDIVMIDYELSRRSWYVRSVIRKHPELFRPAVDRANLFLKLVDDFEEGRPFDRDRLDDAFHAMLNAFLLANYPQRPAYVDFDDNPKIAPTLRKDPEGIIFRLRDEYDGESFDRSVFRMTSTLDPTIFRNERALWIRSLYPSYAVKEGVILREEGHFAGAVKSLEEALFFDPDNTTVLSLLGETYYETGSIARAKGCYGRILSIRPDDIDARRRLDEIGRSVDQGLPGEQP